MHHREGPSSPEGVSLQAGIIPVMIAADSALMLQLTVASNLSGVLGIPGARVSSAAQHEIHAERKPLVHESCRSFSCRSLVWEAG